VINDDGEVSDVVDDLLAEVKAARAADAAAKMHTGRIKELLIRLRREQPGLTLPEIEDMIGRYYDRATISRVTAEAIGTSRPKRSSGS
jgi:hypothetical protein